MKHEKEIDQSRRSLLKGMATAAVAGAVVAGSTHAAVAAETPAESKSEKKTTGYRETQHIRDYYNTL